MFANVSGLGKMSGTSLIVFILLLSFAVTSLTAGSCFENLRDLSMKSHAVTREEFRHLNRAYRIAKRISFHNASEDLSILTSLTADSFPRGLLRPELRAGVISIVKTAALNPDLDLVVLTQTLDQILSWREKEVDPMVLSSVDRAVEELFEVIVMRGPEALISFFQTSRILGQKPELAELHLKLQETLGRAFNDLPTLDFLSPLFYLRAEYLVASWGGLKLELDLLSDEILRLEKMLRDQRPQPAFLDLDVDVFESKANTDPQSLVRNLKLNLQDMMYLAQTPAVQMHMEKVLTEVERVSGQLEQLLKLEKAIEKNERLIVQLAIPADDHDSALARLEKSNKVWTSLKTYSSQLKIMERQFISIEGHLAELESVRISNSLTSIDRMLIPLADDLIGLGRMHDVMEGILRDLFENRADTELEILLPTALRWVKALHRSHSLLGRFDAQAQRFPLQSELKKTIENQREGWKDLKGDHYFELFGMISERALTSEAVKIWRELQKLSEFVDTWDFPVEILIDFESVESFRSWLNKHSILVDITTSLKAHELLKNEINNLLEKLSNFEATDEDLDHALIQLKALVEDLSSRTQVISQRLNIDENDPLVIYVLSQKLNRLMEMKKKVQAELSEFDFGDSSAESLRKAVFLQTTSWAPTDYLFLLYQNIRSLRGVSEVSSVVRQLHRQEVPFTSLSPEVLGSIGGLDSPEKIRTALFQMREQRLNRDRSPKKGGSF